MHRYIELMVALVVVVAGVAGGAGRCGAQALPAEGGVELVDAVVASVDGTPITLLDLEQFSNGHGRLLSAEERASRAALLDTMVNMKMFESEFQRQGITASDSDVNIYIDNLMESTGSSRDAVKEALGRLGLTWDVYFERMRQEVQRLALINREIRARVNITPEEVERTWQEDSKYVVPEKLEIGHIYIPIADELGRGADAARTHAEQAYELARKNFAKAAAEYSRGPNADEGGVLGTFRRDEMAPMFERAVAGLAPGEVGQPFEDEGAYHIVKVIRVVAPERVPLEQVRTDLEEKLYNETLESRFRRWVDEDLRKRHHVTMQLEDIGELVADDRS